eukprot:TRINITY_DN3800_c0_g1_i1.p2 TRINITY_DN3800_c0_g1~~TRINITY_DN3800_c0_g1_i1.p2  ORF type:complete len:439 (-),score=4.76 TRINITY_DN3800_c0_g1_i1:1906-3222(-)
MQNIDKGAFKNRFVQTFSEYENNLNGEKSSTAFKFKKSAFEKVSKLDLPTAKSEDWKYLNLGFLNETEYKPINSDSSKNITTEDIKKFVFNNFENELFVFINGYYAENLSKNTPLDYEFAPLARALNDEITFEYYGKVSAERPTFFSLINDTMAGDGAFIKIKRNKIVEKPIHILHIIDSRIGQNSVFPRNLIVAEENSQAKIFETYAVIGENNTLINQVTEVVLDKNARIDNAIIQNYPKNIAFIGFTQAAQEANSIFNNTTVSIDGKFVRNNINSVLKGSHTETHYYGFYYADEKNIVDNRTFVDHAVPNCDSNEIYKGIIGGEATAIFNGKILVRKDAQKTNAYQSNKNVLLSDGATINTKPELEIYADDVKCSHGATSGALDKEQLFYLRSRGIAEDKAIALLLTAFGGEISEKIPIDEIKDYVDSIIEQRIKF